MTSTIFNLRLLALLLCVSPTAPLVGLNRLFGDVGREVCREAIILNET